MVKLSEILKDVMVRNIKTGKKYDVKKPNPKKHDFAWDYKGSKENPNPFSKKDKKDLNESFDVLDALILAVVQGGVGLSVGLLGSYLMGSGLGKVKDWWNKHKTNPSVKNIVNKLKSDSDIKHSLKNPAKAKEVVKDKLSDKELDYLKQLN